MFDTLSEVSITAIGSSVQGIQVWY